MIKEWLYNNICQPMQSFYHKYILREEDWTNDISSAAQENLDSSAANISQSEHDIL